MTFPPDLRESLLQHNGVELQDGTLRLDHYGPSSRASRWRAPLYERP
ncbi:hypothetical protein [Streptomyces sp. NPDC060022]